MKLNNRGSVLEIALIIGAVISIVGYALVSQYLSLNRDQKRIMASYNLQMISENIQAVALNDGNWASTLANNPSLACLRTPGGNCGGGAGGPINLYLADGTRFTSTSANEGFDWNGNPCNTFDAINGDSKCVFQYRVTWSCRNNPCGPTEFSGVNDVIATKPEIRLTGKATFSPAKNGNAFTLGTEDSPTSSSKYSFSVIRGDKSGSVAEGCKSLGGYLTKDGLCSIVSSAVECPDGQYMKGINPVDGSLDCRPFPFKDTRCNQGDGVTGIYPDGRLRCYLY